MNATNMVPRLYEARFDAKDRRRKADVWRVLCEDFFQRYVRQSDAVLDLGAGYCEFINNIKATRRVALDGHIDLPQFAAPGVETLNFDLASGRPLPGGPYDVVFASNFFEHMPNKDELARLVARVYDVLRPGGRFLILGPNYRFLRGTYWDFYDHHIPLTERSVDELLTANGFKIRENIPQFLPYTMKSRLPSWTFLVRAYLHVPLAWRILGAQFFVVAER